jgi:hypothetical protein
MILQRRSAIASSKTFFAKSTATVVAFVSDSKAAPADGAPVNADARPHTHGCDRSV